MEDISIHALLAESDHPRFYGIAQHTYFYPRSPCGERLDKQIAQLTEQAFLSTLSLRRATTQMQAAFKGPEISIHALLAESDGHTHYMGVYEQISIHALLAESDL